MSIKNINIVFNDVNETDILRTKRCLENLYRTVAGTCPLDRNFGIDGGIVDLPPDVAQNLIAVEIIEKTELYEPDIKIDDIKFSNTDDGFINVEVIIANG